MRVLVLQEIEKNAERVKEALTRTDTEIVCFQSQPAAMEYLNGNKVDLIVTAVHLQSGNVFDFLKWVKGDPLNKHSAFVFFCAEPTEVARYVWPAVQTAATVLGADKYITMDHFDRDSLRNQLLEVVDRNLGRLRLRENEHRADFSQPNDGSRKPGAQPVSSRLMPNSHDGDGKSFVGGYKHDGNGHHDGHDGDGHH